MLNRSFSCQRHITLVGKNEQESTDFVKECPPKRASKSSIEDVLKGVKDYPSNGKVQAAFLIFSKRDR